MAQITGLTKLVNSKLTNAEQMNDNFTIVKNTYNAHDTATTGVHDLGSETIATDTGLQALIDVLCPVGKVVELWRPDTLAFNAIDTDIWALGDGSTISDAESDFDGITLPDFDGHYLIGAGTVGGDSLADDDTLDATPVGNTDNEVDLTHQHTQDHSHEAFHNHVDVDGSYTGHTHEIESLTPFNPKRCDIHLSTTGKINFSANIVPFTANRKFTTSTSETSDTVISGDYIPAYGDTGSISDLAVSCTTNNTTSSTTVMSIGDGLTDAEVFQPESLKVIRYIRYK